MGDVTYLGAMIAVSPQVVEDAKFDLVGYIAQRLSRDLVAKAVSLNLELLLEGFRIERVEGGFWHDLPRTLWQRLLRRPAKQKWIPTVAFRATALARPYAER